MKNKDEVKVESIEIKLGDKTIKLSLDKARQLQVALNDVLGVESVVRWYPYIPFQQPVVIPPLTIQPSFPNPQWTTWCGGLQQLGNSNQQVT